jgi:hypothetical protein
MRYCAETVLKRFSAHAGRLYAHLLRRRTPVGRSAARRADRCRRRRAAPLPGQSLGRPRRSAGAERLPGVSALRRCPGCVENRPPRTLAVAPDPHCRGDQDQGRRIPLIDRADGHHDAARRVPVQHLRLARSVRAGADQGAGPGRTRRRPAARPQRGTPARARSGENRADRRRARGRREQGVRVPDPQGPALDIDRYAEPCRLDRRWSKRSEAGAFRTQKCGLTEEVFW